MEQNHFFMINAFFIHHVVQYFHLSIFVFGLGVSVRQKPATSRLCLRPWTFTRVPWFYKPHTEELLAPRRSENDLTSSFSPRYTFVDILRAILLSLESMIEDPELQVNGFILIIDWSNFTFKQASKLTPSMLRLAIEGLQVRRSALCWRRRGPSVSRCLDLMLETVG